MESADPPQRISHLGVTSLSTAGFNFPIRSEQAIEELEASVRCNEKSRKQYIKFLRSKLTDDRSVFTVFQHIFTYQSLVGYCWTKRSNLERKSMRDYEIFTSCMLDAWLCKGVTEESLAEHIRHVIRNVNISKRKLKIRLRKRYSSTSFSN
nr:uncharacterized protein LOC109404149 [Aedes albopictus]